MFRSSLLVACHVGLTVGLPDCEALTDPDECVQAFPPLCNWLVLEGSCTRHNSLLAQASPPECCGSLVQGSHCAFTVGSIPDGACDIPFQFQLSGPRFDLAYATRMTHIASAAYCESDVATWSCGFHCDAVKGLEMIQYVYYKPANLAAYVAWDSEQDAIIVSFRGTQGASILNWIKNLDAILIRPFQQYPTAKVHQGFYDSWKDLSPDVMAAVANVQAAHGTTKVIVTGHSLGAAMAAISAFDMKLNYGLSPSLIDLGRPRIGNHVFAEAITGEIPSVFRMTHHDDLVPHAPPENLGLYHSGVEVFFQKDDTDYVVCDGSGEDDSCSDRCSPFFCTSVDDHLLYLGIQIGSAACGKSAVV